MNLGNAEDALALDPVLAHRRRGGRWSRSRRWSPRPGWPVPPSARSARRAPLMFLLGLGRGRRPLGLAIFFTIARAADPGPSRPRCRRSRRAAVTWSPAPGRSLVGFLHAVTGTWTTSVLAMLVVIAFEGAIGWQAARARTLPAAPAP